ncbi:MAG: FmdB family zinc ribbon protein [Phycisphaerae bacterium]
MPTYDYECEACGHSFEKFQSMTAPEIRKCPECGKRKVRRLIGTGAGIIFKGSGFYQTDYRSSSYRKGAEAEESSTSETRSESKPTSSKKTADSKPTDKSA